MRASRPNIVVFNPDQWRGDVMHHLGNPAAVTPNLDALATTDGISFRNAFVQATVCTEPLQLHDGLVRDALYDLVADPMETRNRIDDPEARDVLLELRERMLDWYMSTCDIVPMDPDSRWPIREH